MRLPLKTAFQPPSDMGTMDSGGGNKLWKIFGIGCGVLLLAVGIMFAVGSYQVASFCGEGIGVVKTAVNAQKFGGTFAGHIAKHDFEKAYSLMTPRYQAATSQSDFTKLFEKYKDGISGTPVARGFNANQTQEKKEYKASFFFPGTSEHSPTIDFSVVKSGEGENDFLVDTLDVFLAERSVDKELPGQMVMRFHEQIAKGQDSLAYMSMGDSFRTTTGEEAFAQFLKDAGPVFTSGRWEIQNIKYHTPESATVMAISRARSGNSMLIQFEMAKTEKMGFPLWQIEAIAPLVAGDQPSDAKIDSDSKNEKTDGQVKVPKVENPAEKPSKK